MKHAKTLETHEARFTELEARLTALEKRTTAPVQRQAKHTFSSLPVKNAPAGPEAPLEKLTAAEEAFCNKFSLHTDMKHLNLQLQAKKMTEEDRITLQSLKQKRTCRIHIFN
jgi:hypothetical protein